MTSNLPSKLIISSLAVGLLGVMSAFAMPQQANVHAEDTGKPTTVGHPGASGDPTSAGQSGSHLATAQLKVCRNREQAINNIMARINDRGTKQIAVFDTIATRTEAFYTKRGKPLSSYDSLVAAVDTAKTKAQTDLAAMKTDDTLDCTSNDPKGTVSAFKTSLQLEIADLKAYRTAVKNLIVGVKSVQGAESSSSATNQGGQQ
jgi:hypothetical protein